MILGEYSASLRSNVDPTGKYRKLWNQCITQAALKRGVVPMYWDRGFTDNHASELFNRSNGSQAYPDVVTGIINAAKYGAVTSRWNT